MLKRSAYLALFMSILSLPAIANDKFIEKAAVEYSKSYSVSVAEATRRLEIMEKQTEIVEKIEGMFGDSIAGIYFDNENNDFRLVVRTVKKGRLLKDVTDFSSSLSKQYNLPIDVLANSPRNAKSIDNIVANQGVRLVQSMPGIQGLAYNPKKDVISVFIYEPNESKKNEWRNKKELQKISGMDAEIIFDPKPVENAKVAGGGDLNVFPVNAAYDKSPACTAGYSATRNGIYGILTAGHCGTRGAELGTKLRYYDRDGTTRYNMTLTGYDSNPTTGKYHDLSFFELDDRSVKSIPFYHSDKTDILDPTIAPKEYIVGNYVCHYGRITDISCGDIISTSYINNPIDGKGCAAGNPCANTFVRVARKGLNCMKGDSGGPMFGQRPAGIVSSCATSDTGNAIVMYSPLKFASYVGAKLLISPE